MTSRHRQASPWRRGPLLGLALLASATLIMTGLPGVAEAAAPLFTQCPTVGQDTGCGVLITINADGTTTVASDPGQGPFDGRDETLVGVVNSFGSPVANLVLSSTKDIFGFDGDGMCTTTTSPRPAACPFGSTKYEGPKTAFSHIAANKLSGSVDFTGGLAASGGTAYFSLENSLSAADLVIPRTDLSIVKTGPATALVGQPLTYTLKATNNGPAAASGVKVTDVLPPNTTFGSATSSTATCTQAAGTVTCTIASLANGASSTITVKVTPTAAAAGTVTNTGTVTGNQFDGNPGNNSSTVTTTVNPSADLSITKSASASSVTAGTPLTYTVSTTNKGPSAATGVVVTDTLPAGVTFTSATPSQGTCTGTTTITCQIGTLANGATATVTVKVVPNAAGPVTNTATAVSDVTDTVQANNTATVTTTVTPAQADLRIVKTASSGTVAVGSPLTYTLTASSGGPASATGVVVRDALPAGVTFGSATPSQGTCSQAAGVLTCALGTLASGASATVAVVVTPTAAAVGSLSNTATVNGDQTDPNTGNNSSTVTVTVTGVANLTLTKTASATQVLVGQSLSYSLGVSNAGPNAATGVTITDPLPAGVSFVSASASQGSCSQAAGTITCAIGSIASGASATATVVVTVTAKGAISNTATATAKEADPVPADNAATATTTAYVLSGSAFGEQIKALLLNSGPTPTESRSTAGTSSVNLASLNVPGTLAATVLNDVTTIGPDVSVHSTSDVATAGVLLNVLGLTAVHSECTGTPSGVTGKTTIAGLDAGTTHLLNLAPAPNTSIAIPGLLSVVLNEQVLTTAPGVTTLTVNAVHIKTLLGIDIVLAQSSCTVDP